MRPRRILSVCVLLGAVVVVAAGCGGAEGDEA